MTASFEWYFPRIPKLITPMTDEQRLNLNGEFLGVTSLAAYSAPWYLQVVLLLDQPGEAFTGGEFLLVEQVPRSQSRPMVVPMQAGDAVIFAVRERPQQGKTRIRRCQMRHGAPSNNGSATSRSRRWPASSSWAICTLPAKVGIATAASSASTRYSSPWSGARSLPAPTHRGSEPFGHLGRWKHWEDLGVVER